MSKSRDSMWGSQEAPAAGRGSAKKIQIEDEGSYCLFQQPEPPGSPTLSLYFCSVCKGVTLPSPSAALFVLKRSPCLCLFSYVLLSHDFHPQEAAAAACRPHIMMSTFCDLQLRPAEHPHPLQASGASRPLIPHVGQNFAG